MRVPETGAAPDSNAWPVVEPDTGPHELACRPCRSREDHSWPLQFIAAENAGQLRSFTYASAPALSGEVITLLRLDPSDAMVERVVVIATDDGLGTRLAPACW